MINTTADHGEGDTHDWRLPKERMNHRRNLFVVLGAAVLAAPLACFAQVQLSKAARIGLLEAGSASSYPKGREQLIAGLRELG